MVVADVVLLRDVTQAVRCSANGLAKFEDIVRSVVAHYSESEICDVVNERSDDLRWVVSFSGAGRSSTMQISVERNDKGVGDPVPASGETTSSMETIQKFLRTMMHHRTGAPACMSEALSFIHNVEGLYCSPESIHFAVVHAEDLEWTCKFVPLVQKVEWHVQYIPGSPVDPDILSGVFSVLRYDLVKMDEAGLKLAKWRRWLEVNDADCTVLGDLPNSDGKRHDASVKDHDAAGHPLMHRHKSKP
jgi:hypothetical protein